MWLQFNYCSCLLILASKYTHTNKQNFKINTKIDTKKLVINQLKLINNCKIFIQDALKIKVIN